MLTHYIELPHGLELEVEVSKSRDFAGKYYELEHVILWMNAANKIEITDKLNNRQKDEILEEAWKNLNN